MSASMRKSWDSVNCEQVHPANSIRPGPDPWLAAAGRLHCRTPYCLPDQHPYSIPSAGYRYPHAHRPAPSYYAAHPYPHAHPGTYRHRPSHAAPPSDPHSADYPYAHRYPHPGANSDPHTAADSAAHAHAHAIAAHPGTAAYRYPHSAADTHPYPPARAGTCRSRRHQLWLPSNFAPLPALRC